MEHIDVKRLGAKFAPGDRVVRKGGGPPGLFQVVAVHLLVQFTETRASYEITGAGFGPCVGVTDEDQIEAYVPPEPHHPMHYPMVPTVETP